MINLGSSAAIRDLAGFYTIELTTETEIAGIQRNIFQVSRVHGCVSHFFVADGVHRVLSE